MGLVRWAMLDPKKSAKATSVAGVIGLAAMGAFLSGCIGAETFDDDDPYVRISTYYDPDLTRATDRQAASFLYGLTQGSPANVGISNSGIMVTLGSNSEPENGSGQGDALPPCPSRSPGDTIEFHDSQRQITYCVELDGQGKTYFALTSEDPVVMDFKLLGNLERHEDCPMPGYRMGSQDNQVPGATLVHGDESIVVHFGIRC